MAAPSQITWTVFEDFNNSNGVQDTTSTISNSGSGTFGVAASWRHAGCDGNGVRQRRQRRGVRDFGLDGTYAINIAVPNDGPYRVESDAAGGLSALVRGSRLLYSAEFVPDGNTAGVNFGILLPANYCQDNPTLVTCLIASATRSTATTTRCRPW